MSQLDFSGSDISEGPLDKAGAIHCGQSRYSCFQGCADNSSMDMAAKALPFIKAPPVGPRHLPRKVNNIRDRKFPMAPDR
jgi:hypothetical protein